VSFRGRITKIEEAKDMKLLRKSRNLILIAALIAIVVGYIFLARNSISIAPVLLVLGYCILVPIALIKGE
jgi:uncharacterized membrane protein HdeD (DUF308 family)